MSERAFYNRIKKRYDDDELIAAAAKVRDTMNSPGWAVLWGFIEASEQEALSRLFQSHAGASGKAMEQADYARLIGYVAGIKEPQTVALAFTEAVDSLKSPE